MTDQIQQARRAAFEAWVIREHGDAGAKELRYVRDAISKDLPRYGEYVNESLQAGWLGFNAALDSLCIELPPLNNSHVGGADGICGPSLEQVEDAGYDYEVKDCRAAIEQTNMGIKIK